MQTATETEVADAAKHLRSLASGLNQVLFGQEELVDLVITGVLARGHILLEGLPGLGKTELVKGLSKLLKLDTKRVQFTPDLLPGDITGNPVLQEVDGRREFVFQPGPLFTNIVLADEINRASPKTQSSLLEAMQEKQVTIGEQTFPLPSPFFVLATQNPLEQEGTYPLPEAQLDRFMMKVVMDYPTEDEEMRVLDLAGTTEEMPLPQPIVSLEAIQNARTVVNSLYLDEKVKRYIVRLVHATRRPDDYGVHITPLIRVGASPRATINLALAGRAHAFLNGRAYVTPHDIKSVAIDVLRHRVTVTYEAEAEGLNSEQIITRILDELPVP
jgi:MoxR-like ATPase